MLTLFNALDRAFDTLAHMFDGAHDPETPRSRPEVAVFLVAVIAVAVAVALEVTGSTWSLAAWGVAGMVFVVGLLCAWSR
jgi:hypothetical protein